MLVDEPVHELCAGVDLLIHDAQYTPAEFARKSDWGHCTVEYAVWLAERGRRHAAWRCSITTRCTTTTRSTASRTAARACGSAMGVEVFAAYEGLTVELDGR